MPGKIRTPAAGTSSEPGEETLCARRGAPISRMLPAASLAQVTAAASTAQACPVCETPRHLLWTALCCQPLFLPPPPSPPVSVPGPRSLPDSHTTPCNNSTGPESRFPGDEGQLRKTRISGGDAGNLPRPTTQPGPTNGRQRHRGRRYQSNGRLALCSELSLSHRRHYRGMRGALRMTKTLVTKL